MKKKEKRREKQAFEDELQLKFGTNIKLDEEVPWTGETESIKKKEEEFKKVEDLQNAKIKAKEGELEATKREYFAQLAKNSELLKRIKYFKKKSSKLEGDLNNANKQIFVIRCILYKQNTLEHG